MYGYCTLHVLCSRYKEERRRQLAAHVASRLGNNLSSSDEEEDKADRRSYTEFRSVVSEFWIRK